MANLQTAARDLVAITRSTRLADCTQSRVDLQLVTGSSAAVAVIGDQPSTSRFLA